MKTRSTALRSLALPALAAAVVLPLAAPAAAAPATLPAPAAKAAAAYQQLPNGTSKKKTLVIGLDGASLSQITAKNTPHAGRPGQERPERRLESVLEPHGSDRLRRRLVHDRHGRVAGQASRHR